MEQREIYLGSINGNVTINILRKKIKNVHLKVFRSLEVSLSVPENVPDDWIDEFLRRRSQWIDKQITKYKLSSGSNNLNNIRNGSSTQFLGKDMRIYQKESLENVIEIDEKKINVFLKKNDDKYFQKMFEKWWRNTALELYQKEAKKLYNKVFRKYKIEEPHIVVRKMKTMWGSCTPQKGKITLNEYLLKADIRCIQYVILHEMTHLMIPNHSREFYDFLTIHMPDWKERKKVLDLEVVQGV